MKMLSQGKLARVVVAVLILAFLSGVFLYMSWKRLEKRKTISLSDPKFALNGEEKYKTSGQVAQKVAELLFVPNGERPYVTVLQNVEQLKKEKAEFYQYADEGDFLLLYSDKAVIFSPKKEKIISMANIKIVNPDLLKKTQGNESTQSAQPRSSQ